MQKMCLIQYFKQQILKCKKKYNCVFGMCMYIFLFFLSGNFLTSTIILLIFIRVHMREKGGKERKNKRRKI